MPDDETGVDGPGGGSGADGGDGDPGADGPDGGSAPPADASADGAEVTVRRARPEDHDAVAAFTRDTWSDRGVGDYLPDVFPEWVASDGGDQRTFVAERDDRVVGVVQAASLSPDEAWCQGMRVHPEHRGTGVSTALNEACFDWARERGAAVARIMVFSWNLGALAAARANGFGPGTEFRWAHPDPDPGAELATPAVDGEVGSPEVVESVGDAYAVWAGSDAREHLRGLGLDLSESWACSEVTRATFADAERTVAVRRDEGVVAATYRVRDYEREGDDGPERWAEYGAAAWRDLDACRALLAAVARDAARIDADRTRVLIPETARHVSDAARAGVDLAEEPDFVLGADLTGR